MVDNWLADSQWLIYWLADSQWLVDRCDDAARPFLHEKDTTGTNTRACVYTGHSFYFFRKKNGCSRVAIIIVDTAGSAVWDDGRPCVD